MTRSVRTPRSRAVVRSCAEARICSPARDERMNTNRSAIALRATASVISDSNPIRIPPMAR